MLISRDLFSPFLPQFRHAFVFNTEGEGGAAAGTAPAAPANDDLLAALANGVEDDDDDATPPADDPGTPGEGEGEIDPAAPVVDEPAAPKKDDPPAPEPQRQQPPALDQKQAKADPVAQVDEQYRQVMAEIDAFQQKIEKDEFDIYNDGAKLAKLQIQQAKLLDQKHNAIALSLTAQQERESALQYWTGFEQANPGVTAARGQTLWKDSWDAMVKEGYTGDALEGAAEVAFKHAVAAEKSPAPKPSTMTTAKATALRPAAPVSKGGARVTPQANPSRPPQQELTPEEEFDRNFSVAGLV